MADNSDSTPGRKALKQATCVAILAASLAAPFPSEASSVIQGAGYASAVAGSCALLKANTIDAIRRYCQSSWRQAGLPRDEWDDCTQDVMLELLMRLSHEEIEDALLDPGSPHRRELQRSVWCVTQRCRRAHRKQHVSIDQLVEPASPKKSVHDDFDFERLELAVSTLSPTQRDILTRMRGGDSVAEIARSLEIPAARVSDQKYKAVRKLQNMLVGEDA